ncbi:MAG TPA: hypothetical protein VK469_12825 [Candidatus Kapabacteria bacterium]|nr:hypothetical protein [Candidatus Kapabacteria bacterium]
MKSNRGEKGARPENPDWRVDRKKPSSITGKTRNLYPLISIK